MAANLSNQDTTATEQSKLTTTTMTTPTSQQPLDVGAAAPTTSTLNPFEDPPAPHQDNTMTTADTATPTVLTEHTSTEAAPAHAVSEAATTPEAPATTEHTSIAAAPAAPQAPPAATRTDSNNERDSPISPQLATLKAMFPDFDDTLLLSVLESVGNDQDRAVDALLGMSDPEYRTETRSDQPAPMSQTDLDEQFARQLMLQEQEQFQAAQWQGQPGSTPYEPRHGQRPPVQFTGRQQPQPQQQAGQQKDTMAEFQDQFNKFAETGKKTIGSFISKVKAKINEMDQPRPNQHQQSQASYSGSAAGANSGQPPWAAEAAQYGESQQQQQYSHEPLRQTLSGQPAYHAPETSNEPIHLGGYDAIPAPQTGPPTGGSATPPPPTTNTGSGAPIDGSKSAFSRNVPSR